MDPFAIQNDWFTLDFTTYLIEPADGIPPAISTQVRATVDRLQLNSDADYVQERIAIVREYTLDKVSLPVLEARYPFIAHQMRRQDFDRQYKVRFAEFFRRHSP